MGLLEFVFFSIFSVKQVLGRFKGIIGDALKCNEKNQVHRACVVNSSVMVKLDKCLEDRSLPRVRFRLARGSDAPSSGIPPRSGAGCLPERGPVSIESRAPPRAVFRLARGHHAPAASIPAAPAGALNALTFAVALVKGESTPLRARGSCPGTAPPTPLARPSPPLCDTVRLGQQQPRGTVPPTPVRPTRRTLEKGRRSPRREDEQPRRARAGTTP
jgi:hypothetical protein